MKTNIHVDIRQKTFASGLLPELIAVLRRSKASDLIAVDGDDQSVGPELETWCRFTGHSLVEATVKSGRGHWVFRCGAVVPAKESRPVGSRLWLYTNFDCNLRCDYCCMRSSPAARQRELGLGRIQRIACEAAALGVKEIFVTGGEPFLLEDIDEILPRLGRIESSVQQEVKCTTGKRLPARFLRRVPHVQSNRLHIGPACGTIHRKGGSRGQQSLRAAFGQLQYGIVTRAEALFAKFPGTGLSQIALRNGT